VLKQGIRRFINSTAAKYAQTLLLFTSPQRTWWLEATVSVELWVALGKAPLEAVMTMG
jgi:hypothetical protein